MLGQVKTMNSAFSGLFFGLAAAIVLIYLLIVVNFQSWADPFVIITALPAALAGIIWILFATGTTLSVPALTGAIMCMGVATANSVLVISFAKERLEEHGDATAAAIEAGFVRLRPVLMTALAMIIGMFPMALGLGEGGEQNAPLGRAVIGGLMFRNDRNSDICSGRFQHHSSTPRPQGCRRGRRTACRLMQTRLLPLCRGADSISPASRHCSSRVVVVVFGITTRKVADAKLQEWTEAQAIPVVAVAPPDTRGRTTTFSLPGRLEAYIQAQIYARVTGYVKKWDADIGTPVKAGQLLAELDAPDVDQQIMQAEAESGQRQSQLDPSRCNAQARPEA